MDRAPTLICFAVKEEAKFVAENDSTRILIAGMGCKNATENLRKELSKTHPALVLTCGFAGGLNPELKLSDVVFDADAESNLKEKLMKLSAKPARFHCAESVVITAAEKQALWESTRADAVEMESSAMRKICREQKIPSATIRVISDPAGADLPLDFNALMTPDMRINFVKLALELMTKPQKVPQLMRFQKQTSDAARKLAEVLNALLACD
ncbi:MAG TPA: hypothetical protein VFB72_14550 [Verrucomicrobiae bacterium]|nr:hypothetical protein [Verrucomicrobiae bacterium]